MKITKELVAAFISNRCSKEEAEAVTRYIQENPELLNEWFPEEEWMDVEQEAPVPYEWSDQVWENINKKKEPKVSPLVWMRAAAAVIGLTAAVAAYKYFAANHTASEPQKILALALVKDTLIVNKGSRAVKDTLTDGSVVELSPGSSLHFRWGFETNKRDITLSGEALFRVSTDKKRPFTVLSGDYSTTVLGTVFSIKDFPGSTKAFIKLISGKVLVKNLAKPGQTEMLLAGQDCIFDRHSNTLMRKAEPKPPVLVELGQLADGSCQATEKEILFRNLPLPKVLTILSQSYHTPISFHNADLTNRSFTGSVEKTQTLEDVLNSIAELNDLFVTHKEGGFGISTRP